MAATAYVEDGAGFAEVRVPGDAEAVFEYVSDLRNMPTWWPIHEKYRRLIGKGRPGTVYAWTIPRSPLSAGLPSGGITVVTAFERPIRFSYQMVSLGLFSRMNYSFAPVQGGTLVMLQVPSVLAAFPEHTAPVFDRLAAILAARPA